MMKLLTVALAAGFALALALPAEALETPILPKDPPRIVLEEPEELPGELRVMDVGPTRVKLWGVCPRPCDTYFVSLEPKTPGAPGRIAVARFEHAVTRGYYSLGRLIPGTDYTIRVYAFLSYEEVSPGHLVPVTKQVLVGEAEFTTPKVGFESTVKAPAPQM